MRRLPAQSIAHTHTHKHAAKAQKTCAVPQLAAQDSESAAQTFWPCAHSYPQAKSIPASFTTPDSFRPSQSQSDTMTPLLTGRLCQSFVPGNPHCADSTSVRKTNLKICHPVHSIAAAIRCHMLYCIDPEAPQARVSSRKQAKHRVTSAEAITSCCSQAAVKKTNRNLNLHHETAACTINRPRRHKHTAKAQKTCAVPQLAAQDSESAAQTFWPCAHSHPQAKNIPASLTTPDSFRPSQSQSDTMTHLLTGRLCQSFVPGNPHCADSTSVRKTNLKICHPVHSIAAAIRCHMLY